MPRFDQYTRWRGAQSPAAQGSELRIIFTATSRHLPADCPNRTFGLQQGPIMLRPMQEGKIFPILVPWVIFCRTVGIPGEQSAS